MPQRLQLNPRIDLITEGWFDFYAVVIAPDSQSFFVPLSWDLNFVFFSILKKVTSIHPCNKGTTYIVQVLALDFLILIVWMAIGVNVPAKNRALSPSVGLKVPDKGFKWSLARWFGPRIKCTFDLVHWTGDFKKAKLCIGQYLQKQSCFRAIEFFYTLIFRIVNIFDFNTESRKLQRIYLISIRTKPERWSEAQNWPKIGVFFQVKNRTLALGRDVSGASPVPTSWPATTGSTRARSHSSAISAAADSRGRTIWPFMPNDTDENRFNWAAGFQKSKSYIIPNVGLTQSGHYYW